MPNQNYRENSTNDQIQDHDHALQCSSRKPRTLTFLYAVTMVAKAGLKGSPANIMADATRLQPDRCQRCDLWGPPCSLSFQHLS